MASTILALEPLSAAGLFLEGAGAPLLAHGPLKPIQVAGLFGAAF